MLKPLNTISIEKPLVFETSLADYKLSKDAQESLAAEMGKLGYGFNFYTSYAITDKAKADKPANYALIPNQYFVFAAKMHVLAIELYKYFEIYDRLKPYVSQLLGNSEQIEEYIRSNVEISDAFENDADIVLFAKFLDKDSSEFRLGSKRLINDQGEGRGSKDCFGSVILKEINLPDVSSSIFGRLVFDLSANPSVYNKLVQTYSVFKPDNIVKEGVLYNGSRMDLPANTFQKLSKPFLLLAGISGTGKSRFVRKQAQYSGDGKTNFELVSVRPDWHEPSDLLGYISRLNSDGVEYVVTNVLKFMVKAWLNIVENVDADSWSQKPFSQISPFWLCLDEMNLAPVEQYFADYLSVIETREWKDGEYSCDPLLKKDVFEQLKEPALTKLQQDLGLKDHDDLWKYFINHGIAIPFNLIVAGTVNMDETTHGFSRKVIDRALSFDFGEFFPNAVEEFFDETLKPKALSYPLFSHAKFEQFETVAADSDAVKTKAFFNTMNSVLKNTPFELAYRAFNELCLAVISFAPKDDIELAAVFDDFLMCKVLPRIEGDDDKLMGSAGQNILEQLSSVLESQLAVIWDQERPDLLREKRGFPDDVISIPCRSRAKLARMNQLLARGFTSFWP
ncbi:McrB family protein [Shewanella sp. SM95]|uniref:McrB family protein n=1 Tax=Shewanella sp. SM95 TaxID=2912812 RepID=UPI0021D8F0D5|nr:restriction endonuclease [Shewanella sp. SM95]MCU7999881.1 restriction endonuclease [Shewanella sp. SM95]